MPAQTSLSAEIGGSLKTSRLETDGAADSGSGVVDWTLRPASAAGFGGGGGRYSGDEPSAEVSLGEAMIVRRGFPAMGMLNLVDPGGSQRSPCRQSPKSLASCINSLYHCPRYALIVGERCGQGGSIDGSPCSHWHIFVE